MKTIVIAGGGTAGLQLAARLGKRLGKRGLANIVLMDRYRTHLWKPLLHEVAAGKLEPYIHHTSFALQARRYGFRFVQGEFTSLNRDNRTLAITTAGSDGATYATALTYDTLVLAIGGTTQYFGVPGASEHALALDSVPGAEYARTQIVDALRRVSSQAKAADRPARASVAIVGAGATGVQLAAQVRQMSRVLSQYGIHSLDPDCGTEIRLLEASGSILPGMDHRLADRTTAELQAQGIQILLNTRVTEVRPDCLHVAGAAPVTADVTIWTAGVTVSPVLSNIGLQVTRNGRVRVGDTLQTLEDEHIYALGDCASFRPAGELAELPTRAQVAHQQAIYLARALPRALAGKPVARFKFQDRGSVISLADDKALCHLLAPGASDGWQVQGALAKLVHAVIYRRHVLAIQGFVRAVAMTLSQRLERLLGVGYRLD